MKKIRILFLQTELVCGGAEQALFDLLCLMDKSKFEVTVFLKHKGGEWDQKFLDAGINVVDVWDCQKVSRNPLVKLHNLIKRLQISHSLKNNYKNILDICFPHQFDIVVSYSLWKTPNLEQAKGAKLVKYVHGDVATNSFYRDDFLQQGTHLHLFDHIICVSEASYHSFCELTGLYDTTVLCHNPLNSENVRKLAQMNNPIPSTIPVICAVGRLAPEKGFDRLIRIHREILDMGIAHKLVIVGGGPEEDTLLRCIADTKTQDSVLLAGYTPNPYPYIKNCTFMVCSSYTEGLPVIAMEALSLGTPIVSAVPSIGELFGDQVCGIITQNDDASLKDGIVRMLTDTQFYRIARDGAMTRSNYFDGQQMVYKVEEIFTNLLHS